MIPETTLSVGKWKFIHLRRGVLMAIDEDEGCYVYVDRVWQQCLPPSNDPLVYHKEWFHHG